MSPIIQAGVKHPKENASFCLPTPYGSPRITDESPHQRTETCLTSLPTSSLRRGKQRLRLGKAIKIMAHGLVGAVFAEFLGDFMHQPHCR
jgi:hypothetical protein